MGAAIDLTRLSPITLLLACQIIELIDSRLRACVSSAVHVGDMDCHFYTGQKSQSSPLSKSIPWTCEFWAAGCRTAPMARDRCGRLTDARGRSWSALSPTSDRSLNRSLVVDGDVFRLAGAKIRQNPSLYPDLYPQRIQVRVQAGSQTSSGGTHQTLGSPRSTRVLCRSIKGRYTHDACGYSGHFSGRIPDIIWTVDGASGVLRQLGMDAA